MEKPDPTRIFESAGKGKMWKYIFCWWKPHILSEQYFLKMDKNNLVQRKGLIFLSYTSFKSDSRCSAPSLKSPHGYKVRKKKCSRSPFLLEKHWPHMISRLALTTVTSLSDSEEHPVRNPSSGNCCAFKIHLLEPWLWLLFLYKHTHIASPTKSLQKHLPASAARQKIFPLK